MKVLRISTAQIQRNVKVAHNSVLYAKFQMEIAKNVISVIMWIKTILRAVKLVNKTVLVVMEPTETAGSVM